MKLFISNTIGQEFNCIYPDEVEVSDKESFERAVSSDHVMARYKNNYRSKDNFIESDCIAMDLDNDHSEDSSDWLGIEEIKEIFQGVKLGVAYSRNHNKAKHGKPPRPRLHLYFPIEKIRDLNEYDTTKQKILDFFPFFDKNATDGARFFFGVKMPIVEIIQGDMYITEFLKDDFEEWDRDQSLIKEGSRNAQMSHFASRVLVRLGDTEEARGLFDEKSLQCSPPLPDLELEQIWKSALKFYKKVSKQPNYVPPEEYNRSYDEYKPDNLTDIAMAEKFAEYNKERAIYTVASGWLFWNEEKWENSELKVMTLYMDVAKKVLKNAKINFKSAYKMLAVAEMSGDDDAIIKAKAKEKEARAYFNFAKKMNDHGKVSGVLKLARSLLEVDNEDLDADAFILNTPEGIIDLRTGKIHEHDPKHLCTKITEVSPSDKNMELWLETLEEVTGGDKEFQKFLQYHAGSTLIGHVYEEALLIVYGDGGNGKSTIFNSEAHVLGDYAGKIPAESLTTRAKNVKVDLAELCGKRFILASETEEGQRLSASMLKQIASVDDISAERKYYAPFSFTPTHSTILYTNHLPKVGSSDKGTWRRIVVAPFNTEIKNPRTDYIDELLEKASGAILKWMIEGAKLYIENGFKYPYCEIVAKAKEAYQEENNWIDHFVRDRCLEGANEKDMSNNLYQTYRAWAANNGEYVRNSRDFSRALLSRGYTKKKTNRGMEWTGVCVNPNYEAEEDFGIPF